MYFQTRYNVCFQVTGKSQDDYAFHNSPNKSGILLSLIINLSQTKQCFAHLQNFPLENIQILYKH